MFEAGKNYYIKLLPPEDGLDNCRFLSVKDGLVSVERDRGTLGPVKYVIPLTSIVYAREIAPTEKRNDPRVAFV